jgi:ferredoxin
MEKWVELNAKYAAEWPNITVKKQAPADAKNWEGAANKFAEHFSAGPGAGD